MPVTRQIAVAAAGGTAVNVLFSINARRVDIMEDDATGEQGVSFQSLLDNFATTRSIAPGTEPVTFGNVVAHGRGAGNILGMAAQPGGRPADFLLKNLISLGAATTLIVTEYE